MLEFETDVIDIIERAPGVKSFRFKTEVDTGFKAGQFFFVTIKVEGVERIKHFSFSNSPTEKGYVEFTKRLTDSEYSKGLERLKIGDWARLKMPYGSFTLVDGIDKIAFLSGGIGITPIRSMCRYVSDAGIRKDIILIYGNNTEKDIIFKEDFDMLQKTDKNIRVVYTLTSKDVDKKIWRGRTGYINEEMLKEEVPDYKDRTFYICGPPAMVQSLKSILKDKLVIDEDRIKLENFVGY